jgi:hypothetical protein
VHGTWLKNPKCSGMIVLDDEGSYSDELARQMRPFACSGREIRVTLFGQLVYRPTKYQVAHLYRYKVVRVTAGPKTHFGCKRRNDV